MRAARLLFLVVSLSSAALAASAGPRAFAEEPEPTPAGAASDSAGGLPDSAGAVPDSAAAPDSLFRIHRRKGPSIDARRVEPWTYNSIRYRTVAGEVGYLDNSKVDSIIDGNGKDRLDQVMNGRKSLGSPVSGEDRSLGSWLQSPARALPDRRRTGYFVTEIGYLDRLGGESSERIAGSVGMTGFGWMKNLSPKWGLGGVVQFESDLDEYRLADVGLRARRYLNDLWSLEGMVGLFAADYGFETTSRGTPVFAELGVNGLGSFTFFTRFEHHDYTYQRNISYFPPIVLGDGQVTDDAMSLGIRLGPRPNFLVIPAVVIGSLLILFPTSGTDIY